MLITGASSGIGQAIAVRFAQEGANVAMNYRGDAHEVQQTREMVRKAKSGAAAKDLPVQGDISQEDQVREMFRHVIESFGSFLLRAGAAALIVNNSSVPGSYAHR